MRVLITGAHGFVARHLAAALRQRSSGTHLIGADLHSGRGAGFAEWHAVNLTDAAAARTMVAAAAPDVVYHLVGLLRGDDEALEASNVVTARRLLDGLRDLAPAARIVLVGSAAEYGAVPVAHQPVTEDFTGVPTTPYGRAKARMTVVALDAAAHGQQVAIARPFNILGPGIPDALVAGAIIARLRKALAGPAPREISIGRTDAIRDFVAVEDVAAGLIQVAERGVPGGCYNLCSGEGHAVEELLSALLTLAGAPVTVIRDSALLRSGDVDQMIGSRARAEQQLGWRPTITFADSVRSAWEASSP